MNCFWHNSFLHFSISGREYVIKKKHDSLAIWLQTGSGSGSKSLVLSLFSYSSVRVGCFGFYVLGTEASTLWNFTSALTLGSQKGTTLLVGTIIWPPRKLIFDTSCHHAVSSEHTSGYLRALLTGAASPGLERILHYKLHLALSIHHPVLKQLLLKAFFF